MAEKNRNSKAKEKVSQVFNQAKESLKILETLEREALARARTFVRIPSASERKHLTNSKILSSLKKVGVATQAEVDSLNEKIDRLEAALKKQSENRAEGN